jgi:lipopolysaccharide/colanic/teichoic acid biosynthesis glycosyltransferase
MRSRTTTYAIFDVFSVSLIFAVFLYLKAEPFAAGLSKYLYSFLIFLGIWLFISLASNKYRIHEEFNITIIVKNILLGNVLILGVATTIMYMVRVDYYSRAVVLGTITSATVIELIWATLDYYLRTAIIEPSDVDIPVVRKRRPLLKGGLLGRRSLKKDPHYKSREDAILVEIDQEAFEFIFSFARIESPETLVISTTTRFNIDTQLKDQFEAIVNLKRINDIRYLNKFFESANVRLPEGGLFIDFVETKNLRKKRILDKFPPVLNYIAYAGDYVIKRLFPKFLLTKGLYFFLTRGQNRVLTKAETFGRLYSCGFEIAEEKFIRGHLFFVARKIREPFYPENPSYGPFVKLERVGYKGQFIRVYKLRTMHPYAEYLQEYIYHKQGLQEGGKFRSDFRISSLGRFLRMFWLDELPMLINFFRGDLKFVGVRPLSKQYFSLYSRELQARRIKYKPGLIPPFYADKPKSLEEIMESEMRYMDAYEKHPFRTDLRYFFKALFNIIFRRYRSN